MKQPLKTFVRRTGDLVTYYQDDDAFLYQGPKSSQVPMYSEQPWLLERYDQRRRGLVQRYPQVGDTVYVADYGYGDVLYDVPSSLEFTVRFRDGLWEDIHSKAIHVVHHNIKSRSKPDLERRLKEVNCPIRSVEELDFETVRGHFRAFELGMLLPTNQRFDLDTILRLHGAMFTVFDWGGRLREGNEELVVGRRQWRTPPPESLPALMIRIAELIQHTQDELQRSNLTLDRMLYRLAKVYFEICFVHPFWDGNGRTSRLLIELLALNSKLPSAFNWSAIPRFGNRTDRAFEKARASDGKNVKWIADLLRAARDRSQP